jgi:outer membrane biogenesis lipoprotein LolB
VICVRFRPVALGVAVGPWALGLVLSGCAVKRFAPPTDAGTPLPDLAQVHAQLSTSCAGVRTLQGELGLSGRAGDQRLRGRVVAGFQRPGSLRLEGVAPFGPPGFILTARDGTAVLLMPRAGRVVRGASAGEMLGALTGVALSPADLLAILTGCVVPGPRPVSGRVHANGLGSIDLEGGATVYMRRQAGVWTVRAARRDGWQIEYPMWQGAFPATVRLQSSGAVRVDLVATLSQIEVNIDIPPEAFTLSVPADAVPMTVDELRDGGPLRGQELRGESPRGQE